MAWPALLYDVHVCKQPQDVHSYALVDVVQMFIEHVHHHHIHENRAHNMIIIQIKQPLCGTHTDAFMASAGEEVSLGYFTLLEDINFY